MSDPGEPVEIFRGPIHEAFLLRSALEARGIPVYIRDETIKIMDPFITGANALDVVVFCAADRVADARDILSARGDPFPPPEPREAEAEAEGEDLAALGRRVRWSVLSLVLIPIAAFLGVRYLLRTLTTGASPPDHGKTVLAALFAILVVLVGVLVLLSGCGGDSSAEIARLTSEYEREWLDQRESIPEGPLPDARPEDPEGLAWDLQKAARVAGFERFSYSESHREILALKEAVARHLPSPEVAARIERRLAAILAGDPAPRDAWGLTSLEKQGDLSLRLRSAPGDEDALEAWQVLRAHLDPDAPDLEGLRREARGRDNPVLALAAAEILIAAERLPAIDEGLKRDLEAVILALHVLRHREDTGEWPADLESVRPDTVPASPLGMRWELDTDPVTKAPAIFLRGGKRFGAAQGEPKGFHAEGPEEPLFRFGE